MSSERDAAILNAIFNPLFPTEQNEHQGELQLKDNDDDDDDDDVFAPIKALERDGIIAAESGYLDQALSIFTRVIKAAPTRPSGYNNRAQVLSLKGMTQEAVLDLNKAIELSEGIGRTACQAFCQRGLIFWKKGDTEQARKDFEVAAELGSHFAKSQLVKLNPYAALCNQMLKSVFNNLYA